MFTESLPQYIKLIAFLRIEKVEKYRELFFSELVDDGKVLAATCYRIC